MKHALSILVLIAFASAGVIHPQLAEILETLPENEPFQVIVHMNTQADWSTISEGTPKSDKILYLQSLSESNQADILAYLEGLGSRATDLATWWIFNGLTFTATKDIIEAVAAREDVDYVIDNFMIYLDTSVGETVEPALAPLWNITLVSAPLCWNDGFDGSGIIVGNMDTGVDVDHPAFGGRWITGGWFDAVNGQPNPYDDHGHGTHTMGTTCGGDGNGAFDPDIGVAPGANFIAAKAFNASGGAATQDIHDCFQWFATQSAQVVGNSWGSSATTSLEFWDDCVNWRSLGIYPVFSSGNSGPGAGTAGTPGNFPTVTGVGATDAGDDIAGFSSRGPAPNQAPWNNTSYWERPDWNLIQPDISAPGVSINSAAPGGGYQSMQGTSMACPHVTGAVALCLQKNPTVDYTTIYNTLLDYADLPSQGAPYPNNNYGWGRLNCYSSLNAIPTGDAPNLILRSTAVVNDNNGNGKLDPGEQAGIVCLVKNNGTQPATNVQGTLRTTSGWITITDSLYGYGTINAGDSIDNSPDPFDVDVHAATPPGTVADFQLELAAAETTWVRSFSLVIGVAPGTIIWGPKALPGIPGSDQAFVYGVAYDQVGDQIFVENYYSRTIYIYSSDSFVTAQGTISAPDTQCTGISYSDYDDNLWVTGKNLRQVWKLNKSGTVLRQFANPANDYPIGLAQNYDNNNELWCSDRRTTLGATQYIYVSDTLGSATQYNNPIQGYYNSRCMAFDTLGHSFVQTHTWFNSGGTTLDSVGVEEYQGIPPSTTGNRFLLNPGWNIRGIEVDPRDGNFWITIAQISGTFVNQVVKVKGFHDIIIGVEEGESKVIGKSLSLAVYPNPVTSHLRLDFQTPHAARVNLRVYDAVGRLVDNLLDRVVDTGSHNLKWNLTDVNNRHIAGGIYFLVLETVDGRIAQKIIVTR